MALRWISWFAAALAPAVWAEEVVRVRTPAGTVHEMVRVPAGPFPMGTTEGRADERPVHAVYLAEYYIDRFEVSNAQYARFLTAFGRNADDAGHLLLDGLDADAQIRLAAAGYVPLPGTARHPVAEVSWYGARAYCMGRDAVADRSDVGEGRARYRWPHLSLGRGHRSRARQLRQGGLLSGRRQ